MLLLSPSVKARLPLQWPGWTAPEDRTAERQAFGCLCVITCACMCPGVCGVITAGLLI